MKLYNTLSRKVEDFAPADDVVKIYVCGITPYSRAHVGHALRSVVFDVLRRYLEYSGHAVRHVENFTDIDDKMIDGAARQGTTVRELADHNVETYLREMDALNVLRAHLYPKATEEVAGMVEIIEDLVRKEAAYVADGDVYFSVRQRPDYGKLSRRSLDSMIAGARVEVGERKRDDMDFALWKTQKPGEPAWDSPWGPGRPGWHIECSAMSLRYLGETIDIHGGGQELTFPHHENEIAQSETHNGGAQMSRFWVHNGLLMMGGDKMSKSLGNLVTIEAALETYSSDALRLFFLSSHYRSPLVYSDERVSGQERAAERLRNAASAGGGEGGDPLPADELEGRFAEAMDDDLNTPRAIAALFDLAHEINRAAEEGRGVSDAQTTLRRLAGVLGLTLEAPARTPGTSTLCWASSRLSATACGPTAAQSWPRGSRPARPRRRRRPVAARRRADRGPRRAAQGQDVRPRGRHPRLPGRPRLRARGQAPGHPLAPRSPLAPSAPTRRIPAPRFPASYSASAGRSNHLGVRG